MAGAGIGGGQVDALVDAEGADIERVVAAAIDDGVGGGVDIDAEFVPEAADGGADGGADAVDGVAEEGVGGAVAAGPNHRIEGQPVGRHRRLQEGGGGAGAAVGALAEVRHHRHLPAVVGELGVFGVGGAAVVEALVAEAEGVADLVQDGLNGVGVEVGTAAVPAAAHIDHGIIHAVAEGGPGGIGIGGAGVVVGEKDVDAAVRGGGFDEADAGGGLVELEHLTHQIAAGGCQAVRVAVGDAVAVGVEAPAAEVEAQLAVVGVGAGVGEVVKAGDGTGGLPEAHAQVIGQGLEAGGGGVGAGGGGGCRGRGCRASGRHGGGPGLGGGVPRAAAGGAGAAPDGEVDAVERRGEGENGGGRHGSDPRRIPSPYKHNSVFSALRGRPHRSGGGQLVRECQGLVVVLAQGGGRQGPAQMAPGQHHIGPPGFVYHGAPGGWRRQVGPA